MADALDSPSADRFAADAIHFGAVRADRDDGHCQHTGHDGDRGHSHGHDRDVDYANHDGHRADPVKPTETIGLSYASTQIKGETYEMNEPLNNKRELRVGERVSVGGRLGVLRYLYGTDAAVVRFDQDRNTKVVSTRLLVACTDEHPPAGEEPLSR